MILLTHLLAGAVIGYKIKILWLGVILSFVSHYLLDALPHSEYDIKNIENNQWRKSAKDFSKVAIDFLLGMLIIFLLSDNSAYVYICAFAAIIPDGLVVMNKFLKNGFLDAHTFFHHQKVHILKNKTSGFWRFFIQAAIVVILIVSFEL